MVNGADLGNWAAAYGATTGGDVNKDGVTDGADFLLWQQQVGNGTAQVPTANVVPEPNALQPAIWSALLWFTTTAGRRRQIREQFTDKTA
jgi:hypothetical protein